MIIISEPKNLEGVPMPLKNCIEERLFGLMEEYKKKSIADFGSIIVIESKDELTDYGLLGFSAPIEEYCPEYAVTKTFRYNEQIFEYAEVCFVVSDGYGMILLGEKNLMIFSE
ncbi:MAG: hypothetical protein K6B74_12760 [Ruminococcus sp.]|nr:hypothetical protein [Ruminococcus sp.]